MMISLYWLYLTILEGIPQYYMEIIWSWSQYPKKHDFLLEYYLITRCKIKHSVGNWLVSKYLANLWVDKIQKGSWLLNWSKQVSNYLSFRLLQPIYYIFICSALVSNYAPKVAKILYSLYFSKAQSFFWGRLYIPRRSFVLAVFIFSPNMLLSFLTPQSSNRHLDVSMRTKIYCL